MGRPRAWLRAAGCVVLLAAGCVATSPREWINNGFKVGPNYCRPPAPAAERWIQAGDPRVQEHQLEFAEWWSVFEDPVLTGLIETAYHNNLNLRAAATRVLEARARQAIAVGGFFPQTQQITGQYNRVNLSYFQPNNVVRIFQQEGLVNNGNSPFTNHYDDWTTGFTASWELDFWGRIRRSVESTNATLDAQVENYDDALVSLLGDVASNYIQYRITQQRIKIAEDNVKIQQRVLDLVEQQFKVGINRVTKLDVEQARTVLEQTRSTIPSLQIVQGQANDVLCILLGVPPHDLASVLGPGPELGKSPIPHRPDWVAVGVPADLLRRRPDVRSAERQVAAQSAQIGIAEADLYPTIAITGTIGYDAEFFSKLFNANSFFGSLTPNFRWNILNYGRVLNNVRQQDVRTQELVASYQNRVLTAAQEVQTNLRGFLLAQEQAEHLAKSVEAARAATELGVQQFRTGTVDFNRVFNLETTLVQQQDQLANSQGSPSLYLVAVYRALGGGWQLRCRPENAGDDAVVPAAASPAATPAPAPAPAAGGETLPAPQTAAPEKKG
jgi:NodT family efflux transporter outer membrane factor (OMF) lipoprotein